MLELLDYQFFRNALLGVLILSVGAGVLGTYIVTRRMVSICGGITHACFGGLGLGYFCGLSPILTAAFFAVGSALGVQWLSWRGRVREDSAIAVVWALGMAVGVFFVFATPGTVPELNSFLFGNILTITSASLWAFGLYTVALVALMAGAYRQVVAVSFDRDFATVIGLRVKLLSTTLTVMVAVGIVLMIRCVGIMLLMSMLTMPQLTAELFTRRYGAMMRGAIVVSVISSVGGLLLSTVIDVPTAAFIVFLQVIIYALAAAVRAIIRR
jgi:zinc transport system permease protein